MKKLVKIINQRWHLGVGYLDAVARDVKPPRFARLAPFRGVCQVVQDREVGEQACEASAREALDSLIDARATIDERGRPFVIRCHAGLQEIVAPIMLDGRCLGALLCGGFLARGDAGGGDGALLGDLDLRARALSLPADDYVQARERHPWLDTRDVSFAMELMSAAAEEIAAFYGERLRVACCASLASRPAARDHYGAITGKSQPMQELYGILDRVAQSDATVLIQGENGTGKELVARAIHDGSPRVNRRFVIINCSAFNDNLLDSELFGHKKGAFTGAVADKHGLFEVADQGTFFLDEIGDMSPSLQVKVLRVLQEGTFTPVGDTETRTVDVRIIAATNRDLKAMVAAGEFREDLYYRVNVINLRIPPLRERREDIPLLIAQFMRKHARGPLKALSESCLTRLLQYDWPGNVRELENEIERLIVLAGDEAEIGEVLLSERIRRHLPSASASAILVDLPTSHSLPQAVRTLERRMILDALERHGWNKTRASAELEISRRNLIRLVQKYELETERGDK